MFGCYASPDLHQDTVLKLKQQKKNESRNRISFETLKLRYCDSGYAAQLVHCENMISFETEAETTPCNSCSHQCPFFFNKDESYSFLQEEI